MHCPLLLADSQNEGQTMMATRYRAELNRAREAYQSAIQADISELRRVVDSWRDRPMIMVGSGGSYSVASFAAHIHEATSGIPAKAVTPLEVTAGNLEETGVACFSASGRNRDIGVAFKTAAQRELSPLSALVLRDESPLHALNKRFQYSDVVGFSADSFKDGFLAVGSLIASSVLITRAYAEGSSNEVELPPTLEELMHLTTGGWSAADIAAQAKELCQGRTTSVLFTNSLRATSVDLESRFVEAGLGNLHVADLRNFGHGRHFWMHKHKTTTGIVSLIGDGMSALADKTLDVLPSEIPRLRMDFQGPEHFQAITGIIAGLYISLGAGEAAGVDPAKPGVPDFGRRLYRIGPTPSRAPQKELNFRASILRKGLPTSGRHIADWRSHYDESIASVTSANIRGLVMDYDGTIADERDRYRVGLRSPVAQQLSRLLQEGLAIGIATGRGPSAGASLRSSIPSEYWESVLVGYYNGAIVTSLADERDPLVEEMGETDQLIVELKKGAALSSCQMRANKKQISVKLSSRLDVPLALAEIQARLAKWPFEKHIVISSHSVDILVGKQSKLMLVEELCSQKGIPADSILRLGDRALPPGNDAELLDHPLGLSVDQSSREPRTGWAFAPAGVRGVQATVYYLQKLVKSEDSWVLAIRAGDRGLKT